MRQYSVVGKRIPRIDAASKTTGEARFTVDMVLPGMLYGAILRSPYAHARILKIDITGAEALAGVKAVITGCDAVNLRMGFIDTPRYPADMGTLAVDKVRFYGEEVAAVAATTREIAEKALGLIHVDYEELPAIFDPEEALKDGAPGIHEMIAPVTTTAWEDFGVLRKARAYEVKNNIANEISIVIGDIEQGFRQSDLVREDRFFIPSTSHIAMEPHAALASFDTSGKLDVWLSHMGYEHKRYWLAKLLNIPISRVRVHKTYVGGAFGGKTSLFPFEAITAILSRKAGRPVKIILSRSEVLMTCPPSHPLTIYIKTGVKYDGTLVAQHVRIIDDVGAYRGSSPTLLYLAHVFRNPIYNIPNIKHEGVGVYTNKHYNGPKRGHGLPQMSVAIESQMDIIAAELGIDRLEMRFRNFRKKGDILPNGDKLDSYGLPEAMRRATESSGWKQKQSMGFGRGTGIGTGGMFSGGHNYPFGSAAMLKLNPDGRFTLFTGQTEFGGGVETAMCQIAAEELSLSINDFVISSGDSEVCPYDIGNFLSGGIYVSGEAVRRAAVDARQQLRALAAQALDEKEENLALENGCVYNLNNPNKKVSFADLYKYGIQMQGGNPVLAKGFTKAVQGVGFWGGSYQGTAALSSGQGRFTDAYGLAAAVAEVEVDKETGKVKVIQLTVADDCGTDINPLNVECQLESQATMAVGDVLFEEVMTDKGKVINSTLGDYKIPGVFDVPKITTISVQDYEPQGPFGGKEVGETARAAVMAAIVNAVCNAIRIRINELPLTAERIVKALKEAKQQ